MRYASFADFVRFQTEEVSPDDPVSTRLIEVHGNDGVDPAAEARRLVLRAAPGALIHAVEPAGFRCDHGAIVWQVTYEEVQDA